MKKNRLSVLFLLFISFIAYSQSKNILSINAGANYSSYRGNTLIDTYDGNFDFVVGIGYERILNEKLSFEVDLNYENKGRNTNVTLVDGGGSPTGTIDLTYKAKYLNIPLMLKYNVGRVFVKGGGFVSFFLGDNIGERDEITKTLDLGLVFGVGVKVFENDSGDMSIELRNNLGLMNTSAVMVVDNGTIKTNSVNLIASWDFKL